MDGEVVKEETYRRKTEDGRREMSMSLEADPGPAVAGTEVGTSSFKPAEHATTPTPPGRNVAYACSSSSTPSKPRQLRDGPPEPEFNGNSMSLGHKYGSSCNVPRRGCRSRVET